MRGVWSVLPALAAGIVLAGAAGAAMAQQSSTGRLSGLSLSNGLPIQIESDKLEVFDAEHKAIFTGKVNVTQGATLLKAGKMTVYYVNDGGSTATGSSNIDRIEVQDKVYMKSDQQVATGDMGTFEMASEVLTLTGKEVVLSEGTNVLVGCKLTVNMKNGRAQVDGCGKGGGGSGRVMMSITPSAAKPQP
jgi:lipopolysaccharide export system protein LptA